MQANMYSIETFDLERRFGKVRAVDKLNVKIKKGEIFGLLGPNGAGKTTFISMLCTLLKPTFGTAKVNGFDIIKQRSDVRRSIGIVFQDPSLDDRLTGRENLEMHAGMYGVPIEDRQRRIKEVLEIVTLADRANDIVKTYSGGMKRRLEIARGLIHYPKILFLDEPTIGLDPQTREHIWEYIKKLAEREKITIIVTTHYMEEADELCDRIAIIDYGKIIALDTPKRLKDSLGGDTIILDVDDNDIIPKALKVFPGSKQFNGQLLLSVKNAGRQIEEVLEKCKRNRITVIEANIRKPSLGDVFLHYTGREIRDENGSEKDAMRRRFMRGR